MKKNYFLLMVLAILFLSTSADAQPIPSNDNCNTALTLIPSADNSLNGTAGTLTNATTSVYKDCDNNSTYDVWYKFKATAKYHRIIIKYADMPASTRLQLYTGNCSMFTSLACVLNSYDSTVYDGTDLTPGKTYYIKVYSPTAITNNFYIGIVTPLLSIDKNQNLLTNGSFEDPVQPIVNWDNGVGPTFNGWALLGGGTNIGVVRVDGTVDMASPDSGADGNQYIDMPGFDDSLYQNFTLSSTSTIFFSGHFANQFDFDINFTNYTAYCIIENANGAIVARSAVMNFDNTIGHKAWYKLSGIAYNLPPGNYRYVAFVSNYSDFDNAFVQVIPTISISDKSVTEGNSGTTTAKLKVTLSSASASIVTVNYTTADSTATAGTDYVAKSGKLKFNPGQTSKTISILINGDTQVEPIEKIKILLSAPVNATIADGLGVGTIKNDDAAAIAANYTTSDAAIKATITLKVSPNPAKNQITVSGLSAGAANYIELTDLSGRSLLKQRVTGNIETLSIAKYASGIYLLRYFDGSKVQQVKLVKE
ncbi:hypothetical protein BH11BAC6_BH11BAC6_10470 [soil metagenome]